MENIFKILSKNMIAYLYFINKTDYIILIRRKKLES